MAAQEKVTLRNGMEFTIQNPGAMWYLEFNDECRNAAGVLQQSKYVPGLLRNCVVEAPKVEDFDGDFGALEELVTAIEFFLRGK